MGPCGKKRDLFNPPSTPLQLPFNPPPFAQTGTGSTLQTHLRLDGITIHHYHIGLGLHKTPGKFIDAKIHDNSIVTIPTHCQKASICIVPEHPNQYGAKKHHATMELQAPLLDNKAKHFIQQVCQKFLFLSRAVDSTLLCPISAIASQSFKPTEDTLQQTLQLLDYLALQKEAILSYHASNMVLAVHSNASYLSKPKARSRAGRRFFLSSNTTVPPNYGGVLNIAHIIKNIMSLATKVELAGLYVMTRKVVYIRIILKELRHKQLPTPLQTDNAMADAVINGKVLLERTKAMGMRFHWLKDHECQQQFRIYWRPSKLNYVDYWTKHHPELHHCNMCKEFLTPFIVCEMLQMELQQQQQHINAACAA